MAVTQEDNELWAATRVIDQHAAGDGCQQCHPDGCRLHDWAAAKLAMWERANPGKVPTLDRAPGWSAVAGTPAATVEGVRCRT